MPRRDGTGPLGQGALTGRGVGPCNTGGATRGARFGAGFGAGAGAGRGFRWWSRRDRRARRANFIVK